MLNSGCCFIYFHGYYALSSFFFPLPLPGQLMKFPYLYFFQSVLENFAVPGSFYILRQLFLIVYCPYRKSISWNMSVRIVLIGYALLLLASFLPEQLRKFPETFYKFILIFCLWLCVGAADLLRHEPLGPGPSDLLHL